MIVHTDDNLYRVDRTYLGPKALRFPWRATYRDYGIWLGLLLFIGALVWRIGIPINFFSVVIAPLVAARLTQAISRALTHDRPLREALIRLGQELRAQRPVLRPRAEVVRLRMDARHWRAGAKPDPSRLVRWSTSAVAIAVRTAAALRQLPKRARRAEREDLAVNDPELAAELEEVEQLADPTGPDLDEPGEDRGPDAGSVTWDDEKNETSDPWAGAWGNEPNDPTNPWQVAAAQVRAQMNDPERRHQ